MGITNQDLLQTTESEKMRKYDLLANELGTLYKCKTRIIPYVMTWDGVVSNYHKKYLIKSYKQHRGVHTIQSRTLETVSFEFRRGIGDGFSREEEVICEERLSITVGIQA